MNSTQERFTEAISIGGDEDSRPIVRFWSSKASHALGPDNTAEAAVRLSSQQQAAKDRVVGVFRGHEIAEGHRQC